MKTACWIRWVSLRGFRNYARADVGLRDGLTVLVGANGQGKSNFLEAVYVVATGRSYRTVREVEVVARGEAVARVRAVVVRRGREEEQEVVIHRAEDAGTVQMRVGGVETPRSRVLGRVPVVVAAPWDLDVVRGAAVLRRRLLDAALAQMSPAYYFALHRYYRTLTQRNAALRRRAGAHLEPWEAQMIALGARVVVRRRAYVARLSMQAEGWFQRLGGTGALRVRYRPSWAGASEEDVALVARGELTRRRADELRRGVTLSGPQRDDVELLLDDVPLRTVGSLGQWRLAMLAVRFAEREALGDELGVTPILLLDDVLAELDEARQRRVLQLADAGQVLATTTALPAGAGGDGMHVLRVADGAVREDAWSHRSVTS
jgi:DNA replication and repair protein RecF